MTSERKHVCFAFTVLCLVSAACNQVFADAGSGDRETSSTAASFQLRPYAAGTTEANTQRMRVSDAGSKKDLPEIPTTGLAAATVPSLKRQSKTADSTVYEQTAGPVTGQTVKRHLTTAAERSMTNAKITTTVKDQTTSNAPIKATDNKQTTLDAPVTTKTIEQTSTIASKVMATTTKGQATTNAPKTATTEEAEKRLTNAPITTTTIEKTAINTPETTLKTEEANTNATITSKTTKIKAPIKTSTTTEKTAANTTEQETTYMYVPVTTTAETKITEALIAATTASAEQTTTNTTANAPTATITTEQTTTTTTKTTKTATTTTEQTTTTNAPIATPTTEQITTTTNAPITTVVATSTSLTPTQTVKQTLQPHCRLRLHSNLFECPASNSRDQTRSSSKSDENRLDLLLPSVGSRPLCCRDSNKSVWHPDGLVRGPGISVNCSMVSPSRELSPETLHCYDRCNATLRLSPSNRYYSLFLPMHDVPSKCHWKLEGVTQVTISANSNLKRRFPWHFLCLARQGMSAASCFSLAQQLSPAVTAYPLSDQPPQMVNITCGGDCLLHYSWAAARTRLGFRSFKIELVRRQSGASDFPTTGSTGADSQSDNAPSKTVPPLEFRVTRGVLAGVLASGIILLGVAFCIWAYRSWQFRMYSSPLRRLVGRTPLHRLPAYSSRMFDLEQLQLDRPSGSPSSRKASSNDVGRASLTSSSLSTTTAAAAASAAGAAAVEGEELMKTTEKEAAGSPDCRQRRLEVSDGAVNRGFRM